MMSKEPQRGLSEFPSSVCRIVLIAGAGAVLAIGGCNAFNAPLDVAANVELERYTGRWYEIARYPNSFERGCVGVTADYTLRPDGRITVLNTCIEGSLDGTMRSIEGVARVPEPSEPAKLAVSFFGPFEGDYWILEIDEDYQYAVVGEPGRNFLWILSRDSVLDDTIYQDILTRLPGWGYAPERLELVLQDEG